MMSAAHSIAVTDRDLDVCVAYAVDVSYEWFMAALLVSVTKAEAIEVLFSEGRRWPRPFSTVSGVQGLSIWGRTDSGRAVIVHLRPLGGTDFQIVGAAAMTDSQLAEFTEWEETGR